MPKGQYSRPYDKEVRDIATHSPAAARAVSKGREELRRISDENDKWRLDPGAQLELQEQKRAQEEYRRKVPPATPRFDYNTPYPPLYRNAGRMSPGGKFKV